LILSAIDGKEIYRRKVTEQRFYLDSCFLSVGIYALEIVIDGHRYFKKVMITN
jgi:hypothetical protein